MKRIRLAMALVSLAALGLVALLAWRASQGLAAERAVRHEAVAERAFEEMERALSAFLSREEERPFEHYAAGRPGSGEASPLAGFEPFVVGAFQQGPDGSLATLLEGEGDAADPGRDRDVAAARVRRVVTGLWSSAKRDAFGDAARAGDPPARAEAKRGKEEAARRLEKAASPQGKDAEPTQAPGTTRVVSGPGVGAAEDLEQLASDALKEGREPRNTFDLLESLNRSADDRAERRQKVARAPASAIYGRTQSEAVPGADAPYLSVEPEAPRVAEEVERYGVARPEARAPEASVERQRAPAQALRDTAGEAFSEGPPEQEADLANEATGSRGRATAAPPPAAPSAPTEAPARARTNGADADVRVVVDPMVGIAVGDDLVLYRTVLVGQGGYRQGLVLDRAALGAWLEARVVGASALADVARVSFDASAPTPPGGAGYLFAHRFAEPFDALHATLALASLPGVASPLALYALVGVLLAVGAAGLVAVHRTASVTVQYAERRSNFAAAVTHELKTPLTAIRMYAEMLRDGLVSGEAKREEYYATITDESERLSRLVDNVLEFSKLEGGRRELQISVGHVGPVLEEAAEKLRAHAAREGFVLLVEAAPDLPAVRFDRDALLQVLFNLVDNAMKYAKTSDTRRVEIRAARDAKSEGVVVSVRDFGPGVASGHEARIFEPFYRGESELTRTTKGTGIGLALVKELAERMDAAVSSDNAEGGGFRVGLAFPLGS